MADLVLRDGRDRIEGGISPESMRAARSSTKYLVRDKSVSLSCSAGSDDKKKNLAIEPWQQCRLPGDRKHSRQQ